jgi:hypothetical protein
MFTARGFLLELLVLQFGVKERNRASPTLVLRFSRDSE